MTRLGPDACNEAPISPLAGENGAARFSPQGKIVGSASVSLSRATSFTILPRKWGEAPQHLPQEFIR